MFSDLHSYEVMTKTHINSRKLDNLSSFELVLRELILCTWNHS